MSIPRHLAGAIALLLLVPTPGRSHQDATLTLQDVVLAARQHPEHAAALATVEAAGFRAEQAGRWPNPEIAATQENFPDRAVSDQFIAHLSQRVKIGGQPGLAADSAEAERQATQLDADVLRDALTLRAQREYVQGYAWQSQLRQVEAAVRLNDELLQAMLLRHAEGDVSTFDVARLRLGMQTLESLAAELRVEFAASTTRLAALTGLAAPAGGWVLVPPDAQPSGPPALAAGEATESTAQPATPADLAAGPMNRPEVIAEMERERQALLQEKLARREAIPDLVVNAGYSRIDPGFDGFVWSLGIALPLFDGRRAAAEAAAAEGRARRHRVEALQREVVSQRRLARDAYAAASGVLLGFGDAPDGVVTAMARAAYEEGEIGVAALLDAIRAELEAGLRRIEFERRRNDAWFLWKWAAGPAPEEVGQ